MNKIGTSISLPLLSLLIFISATASRTALSQVLVPPASISKGISSENNESVQRAESHRYEWYYGEGSGGGLSIFQAKSFERLKGGSLITLSSLTLLAVRVDFADRKFDSTVHDSVFCANELRHLAEYYSGASRGRFVLKWDLAPKVVHLRENEGYYGEDGVWDERVLEILQAVVDSLDEWIDFSQYDAFAVIHAGAGQETDFNGDSPWQLWSGFLTPRTVEELLADSLGTPGVETNDSIGGAPFFVDNLIVVPETASQDDMTFGTLGIYAYELGYRLGMFPLFDTTPSGYPDSQGIGVFGLMSYGLYNANGFVPAFPCAFHRYMLGWADVMEVDSPCSVDLTDVNSTDSDTVIVKIPVSSTEYFLLANRVHDTNFNGAFDFIDLDGDGIPENEDTLLAAEFDYFLTTPTNPDSLTGSGLMIWHIDEAVIASALASGGYPEDNRNRKGVDLEEADGIQDLDSPGGSYAFGSYLDSYRKGNNDHFGSRTNPSSANNNGALTGIDVSDISEAAHVMSFKVNFLSDFENSRLFLRGRIDRLSIIPFSSSDNEPESLYVTTDDGFIFRLNEPWKESWKENIDTLFIPEEKLTFSEPPVFANLGGDAGYELLAVSEDDSIFAFECSGGAYPVDDDSTAGIIETEYSQISSPVVMELDGDGYDEAVFVASREDSIFILVMNSKYEYSGNKGRRIGSGTMEYFLHRGQFSSNLVSLERMEQGRKIAGVCFVEKSEGRVEPVFVPLTEDLKPIGELGARSLAICSIDTWSSDFNLTSGDIDGDERDDVVFTEKSGVLVFVSGDGGCTEVSLDSREPSSCVLSDLDGDGILETLVQDRGNAYLFTGFGVLVSGWPRRFPISPMLAGDDSKPRSALAFDLNADGKREAIFNINGDIYAFDFNGRLLSGWPKAGESGLYSYSAILAAQDGGFFLFTSGYEPVIGGIRESSDSFIRRIDLAGSTADSQSWRFFRHDVKGTWRQGTSSFRALENRYIDESSFICYPNPVRGDVLNVRLAVFSHASITVKLLNLEGEEAYSACAEHMWLENSNVPFELSIPVRGLASGIYVCLLDVAGDGWSWRGKKKVAIVR